MKRTATLDIETDPFLYGRVPIPFACGFYDGEKYFQTWGDNCIAEMADYLAHYPVACEIYAHNGGKFDWYYFSYVLGEPLSFINNRLIKASLYHHIVRDSYAVIPAPLRDYKKDKTDYNLFESDKRESHKTNISLYLKHDCIYLYELISSFISTFGNKLTIASAAQAQLRKYYELYYRNAEFDSQFRPFYFGGRVECFQKGMIIGNLKMYDINSSYPNAMANFDHPAGNVNYRTSLPDNKFYFAEIIADSDGALPVRTKTGITFPHGKNLEFMACSHEINAGLDTDTLRIKKTKLCYAFSQTQRFDKFVNDFFKLKIQSEIAGDKTMRLFYKLLLNNAYGKFAQNPDNFKDYTLDQSKNVDANNPWIVAGYLGETPFYARKAQIRSYSYHDVAIGASITSAARAALWRAICASTTPIYCDTDSLVCESLAAQLDPVKLGAWKCEANIDRIAVAGKKMYCAFRNGVCVKAASKGIPADPDFITKIATTTESGIVQLPAPSMRIGQQPRFIARTIRST